MGEIKVLEKPANVSWDDIHEVLYAAHAENRSNGVVMQLPSLSGDEIRELIGRGGKIFVALDGEKVIGTAAVRFRKLDTWCHKGETAYLCFASVLPEYRGTGVYKLLCETRSAYLDSLGYRVYYADTHVRNRRVQEVLKKQGYKFTGIKRYGDHFNVLMFKWVDGSPYSDTRIGYERFMSSVKEKYLRPVKNALKKIL